jgi:hypothetical protein
MLPINNDLLNNGWQLRKADPRVFIKVFDGNASKFSHRSFYELSGTIILFVEEFIIP